MAQSQIIFLPESIVQELAGKKLPNAGAQEFEYNGKRYKARQRDPNALESEIPCELISEGQDIKKKKKRKR